MSAGTDPLESSASELALVVVPRRDQFAFRIGALPPRTDASAALAVTQAAETILAVARMAPLAEVVEA
jgi:hypothetical protein